MNQYDYVFQYFENQLLSLFGSTIH